MIVYDKGGAAMNGRQQLILDLLSSREVRTQKELMELLSARGMECTQSTISRDIRALGLVKQIGSDGLPMYVADAGGADSGKDVEHLQYIAQMSAPTFTAVNNLIIVKTIISMANAVCTYIDRLEHPGLLGSLAGVDTIVLFMKDNDSAAEFCEQLKVVCNTEDYYNSMKMEVTKDE